MQKSFPKPMFGVRVAVLVMCSFAFTFDLFALSSKKVLAQDQAQALPEERLAAAGRSPMMSEEQWVMLVYQKGKENYDRGDYKGATSEWDKLSGVIDRYPAFKTVTNYLRGRVKNISPEAANQVEQQLEARRKQIDTVFQKGKEFYDQGKMPEALEAWAQLSSYLPEDAPQRKLIEDLRKYYVESSQTPEQRVMSKETSAEMLKFFASAAELFKTQAIQAKKALGDSENAQKAIEEAYEKGKLLYYQGNTRDAVNELQKLVAYFPEGSKEREAVDTLVRVHVQATDEKNAAERAMAERNVKVKLPPDFSKFSAEVKEKFEADLKEAEARRSASERSLEDKQSWTSEDFQKGVEYYRKGEVDEALRRWEQVAPSFENEKTVREIIETVRKNQAQLKKIVTERDNALAEKQALINGRLEKGRLLYEAGNYEEAQKEWASIKGLVDDDRKVDEFVSAIKKIYQDSLNLSKVEEEARKAVEKPLQTPDSLSTLLGVYQKKLSSQIESSRTAQSQKDNFDQQKTVLESHLQKGSTAYETGDLEGAKKEWLAMKALVQDPQKVDEFVAAAENIHQEALKMRQVEDESRKVFESPLQAPSDLSALLNTYQDKLSKQIESARTAQSKKDDMEGRRALLNSHMQKGKSAYETGDIAAAKKSWLEMKALVQDPAKVDEFVVAVEKLYNETQAMQKTEEEAKAAAGKKIQTPESLSVILGAAEKKLQDQVSESKAQREASETAQREKKALVDKTIANGKMHWDAGRLDEAIKEWSALLGLVEDSETLKKSLEALKTDREQSIRVDQEAKIAESKKDAKVALPEDLSKLLLDAGRQIRAQIDATNARKVQAEQSVVDRQAYVNEHFAKGKTFFDADRYAEALQEWSSILPSLDEGSKLKPLTEELVQQVKDLAAAQKAAQESETKKATKLSAPQGFEKMLQDAQSAIKFQTEAAKAKRNDADQGLLARQKLVQNTFDKGKEYFDAGKYSDALKEWSAVLDEFEGADALRTQIKEIEARYAESIEASKTAEAADLKKNAKLEAPAGLKGLLTEIQQKILTQTKNFEERKSAAQKVHETRLSENDAVFAKGKVLYEEGNTAEALNQWSTLLPSLEDEAKLREVLSSILSDESHLKEVQKQSEAAEELQSSKVASPAGLEKLMNEISVQMKGQISQAEDRLAAVNRSVEDKKTLVNNTFEKGKAHYDEGRFHEALLEWKNILPAIDNGDAIKVLWEQAAKEYEQLAFAQKAATDAESKIDQKVKSPDSLLSFLQGMTDQLRIRTLEVKDRRSEADHAFEMKQSEIDKAVMRGNSAFREGKIEEAQKEWLSILPGVEDEATVKTAVEALTKIHEERENLKKMELETANLPSRRFKAPSDISSELSDAAKKLSNEKSEAETKRREVESTMAKRQAEMQSVFDEGKRLYWEGKIADAIQKWASVAPLLEDSEIKKGIDALALSYDKLLQTQKQTQEAELKRDNKLKTPEELPKMLSDARQVIQSQTQYAETQKKIADQTFVDRQALINTTFQKGKSLYEQDRIPEALEEWAAITPYLEKGSELKEFIDSVAKNYENSLVAKRVAEEAEVKKSIKFRTPEDLTTYLNEASQKLQAQVTDSQMQKEAAERLRRERQTLVDGKFQKGKLLYEKGKIVEAIDEWKAILPYIEDDSKVRQLILKAEESRQQLGVEPTAPAVSQKVVTPPDLGRVLDGANGKLQTMVQVNNKKKLEEDVRNVIQNKKESLRKQQKSTAPAVQTKVALDEIEQMMLEYNIATPAELEKRHRELKTVQ